MTYAKVRPTGPVLVFTGLMFAAAAAIVVVVLRNDLETAIKVVTLVVTGCGAGGAAWRWLHLRSLPKVSTPGQLDDALEAFVETLESQWRAEAGRRGLLSPAPARVTWEVTQRPVGDRPWALLTEGAIGRIYDLFEDLPYRRLVIIGAAGTGKTTAALLLLLDALARRRIDGPVLALFTLSSWDAAEEHLVDFIARQLARDHPYLKNPQYGASAPNGLVASGRVIPICDGLDDVPEEKRALALTALNQCGLPGLILTSRAEEYQQVTAGQVLAGAAVIELLPVDLEAAIDFLSEGRSARSLAQWAPVFDEMRANPDGPVRTALITPLMLSLARRVYAERPAVELLDGTRFTEPADVEAHLLDGFVPALYSSGPERADIAVRQRRRYDGAGAVRWLGYIARQADLTQTYDLAWWRTPRMLPWPCRATVSMMLFALLAWVLTTLVWGNSDVFGILLSAVPLIAFAIAQSRAQDNLPVLFGWAFGWAHVRYSLTRGAFLGLRTAIAVAVAVAVVNILVPQRDPEVGEASSVLFTGLVAGAVVGFIAAVGAAVSRAAPTSIPSPAQSFRAHCAYLLVGRLLPAIIVVAVLTSVVAVTLSMSLQDTVLSTLVYGMAITLAFGLGDTGGQYLVAVGLLALAGKRPWRLLRFLEDAHQRGVLRQQGATYQFRHARLQDRLAATVVPADPVQEHARAGTRSLPPCQGDRVR